MSEHRLFKEPQPIADQWKIWCSCGWRGKPISLYEFDTPASIHAEIDRRFAEHLDNDSHS